MSDWERISVDWIPSVMRGPYLCAPVWLRQELWVDNDNEPRCRLVATWAAQRPITYPVHDTPQACVETAQNPRVRPSDGQRARGTQGHA